MANGGFLQGFSFGKPIGDPIRDQAANHLKAVEQQWLATRDCKMRLPLRKRSALFCAHADLENYCGRTSIPVTVA
jgi:hypothetical protein